MRRRQSRRWWTNTPWNKELGEGSEQCWVFDWMLTEADMLPDPTHAFWRMGKELSCMLGERNLGRIQRDGQVK